jgi:predicted kinase
MIVLMENTKPVLYIFSGLPGVGKSTLAQYFAEKINAVYIRIDTIEQGIRDLCKFNVQGEGYRLAYRIVEDNLKIGNSVISDQCNTIKLTREEWKNIALKNNCEYMNIEILCSNKEEHKNRIENRETDVENLKLPTWEEVMEREYEPWEEEHLIIDTANKGIEECINELIKNISNHNKKRG